MTLENELVSDITIDIDIKMMTSKRCNQGKVKTPILLHLEDTKENFNIVERYIFWNVIWKSLNKIGWILDKDGNYECDFIAISPLDPICNTMKKNMDFFEDEVELMLALFADPRLVVQSDHRELRVQYDGYLLQYKLLRAQLTDNATGMVPANLPQEIASNKGMLKMLKSRLMISNQVKKQRAAARDEKESLLIQSIIARQEQEQALALEAKHIMEEPETHVQRRKRLHREMVIKEYERRKKINGGKFPTTNKIPQVGHQQQQPQIVNLFLQNELDRQTVQEANIRDAIASACQPQASTLERMGSMASLQKLVQEQQQKQIIQQRIAQQQQIKKQMLPRSILPMTPTQDMGNLPHVVSGPIEGAPRGMTPLGRDSSYNLMQYVENIQRNNNTMRSLKLSWNEIKDAYHDLKSPGSTTVPPSLGVPNKNFTIGGAGSSVLDTLGADPRKRLRLF